MGKVWAKLGSLEDSKAEEETPENEDGHENDEIGQENEEMEKRFPFQNDAMYIREQLLFQKLNLNMIKLAEEGV